GGDAAGAAADINAVRSRSQAKKLYSAGEVDLEVILDERARELAWEEMRWPTLMRMGKGGQTSKGENPVVKKHLETHTFSAEIMPETFANRTLPEWTLFAIPFNAINLNKDGILDQNYGWTNPE
ncbi:MAG: RagB/SusD family nutrient uptake outer membrane protein, partial [Bacteroidales bacterium]|nr:RagB/SusD family nutrient uptake outer membrane protein [Bacteroidales bacterium]